MQFCTDQSGKFLARLNQEKIFRCLGIDFRNFTQHSLPEINFLEKSNKIYMKSWMGERKKSFRKNFHEEKYLIFFFFSIKNTILILDSRKKKGFNITIKKIESFSNFKNIVYFFCHSSLFFLDLLSGEFFRNIYLGNIFSNKIDSKVENSYNGKFIFILNRYLLIIESKTGIFLKKISKKLGFIYFFGLCRNEFLFLGEKKKRLYLWKIKNNFYYPLLIRGFSLKKKNKIKFIIQTNFFLQLVLKKERDIVSFFIKESKKEKKETVFSKILKVKYKIQFFDLLKNSYICLFSKFGQKLFPITFWNTSNSNNSNKRFRKISKNTRILTKKNFSKNQNFCLLKIKKKIVETFSSKKFFYKKKHFLFQIKYQIFKQKNNQDNLFQKNFSQDFNFFFRNKIFQKTLKNFKFFNFQKEANCLFLYKYNSLESILNFFIKKVFTRKDLFDIFSNSIKELFDIFFVFMSRNQILKKIFYKINIYIKNLKNEYFFLNFLGTLNILIKEISLF